MNSQHIPGKQLREMITGFRKIISRHGDDLRRLKIDLARGSITATDGSGFLSYQLGKPVSGGGRYLMAFDGLLHFAKGLPAKQEIHLEATTGARIRLRAPERMCFAETMEHGAPFADPPRLTGHAQLLHPEDREAVLRALSCVSKDEHRHTLRGVYFDDNDGREQVVATDGRCLYHEPLRKLEIPRSFILPASPLLSWRGFRHEWQLKVSRGKKAPTMIQLTAGPWTFTTPAIEGNYPDWRQIVPDLRSRPTRITLGEDDLRTLDTLAGDPVGFQVTDKEVRFLSQEQKAGRWDVLPAQNSRSKGPASTVYLDPKFLGRALKTGMKEACLAEELDPILFRGRGQLVVMPLRVSGPDIPDSKPKPPTPTQAAPAPRKPMEKKHHHLNQQSPADQALESLKALKVQLRESIGHVDQAARFLREAQAHQRATQKDIKTIRGTLQSLKKVAFTT